MRKGKNGQADLDKGFKTGYFSFFNHQACVFYLCDMNYRAVQEKRKHLKYQGFLPWNKGRSIGQSKKTVQYLGPHSFGGAGGIRTHVPVKANGFRVFSTIMTFVVFSYRFQAVLSAQNHSCIKVFWHSPLKKLDFSRGSNESQK